MNRIELLQRASTESVPVLRRVTEHFRRLFPELKLQPNALERTPKADTFMTTNIGRQYGEITSIENDFVNTQTQKVESKIQSRICDGLENPRAYQLQEMGQKGEVLSDLDYIEGLQYGKLKQFKYGTGSKPTEEIVYDTNGQKLITTFDEQGKTLTEEYIPSNAYKRMTEYKGDGNMVHTVNQKIYDLEKLIGDSVTKVEKDAKRRLVKLTRSETNWGRNYESLIEINLENGRVVKFSLPGDWGHRNIHLEAEYAPNGFSCKSYKFSRNGRDVLNVVFDEATGKPVRASGSYVDGLREQTNYLSGKPLTEEEILDKVNFKPIVYDNEVHFALEKSIHFDHSLFGYLKEYAK